MNAPDKTQADGIAVAARIVPPPGTVSPQARDHLSHPVPIPARPALHPDDVEGWKKAADELEASYMPAVQLWLGQADAGVEVTTISGVTAYRAEPHRLSSWAHGKLHLHIHGGGWAFWGGEACRGFAAMEAHRLGCRTISVDYRRPPDHRFPAALDDCVLVYRRLVETHDANDIVISGISAGANLAAATTLRVRDERLPTPGAVVLLSPGTDAALRGDTLVAHDGLDHVIRRETAAECWAVYAGGHDPTDPYLSPVYGDFSKGFPPTFIQTGTRDLFLSDSVRLHRALRRAGASAELHVWEAMPHGGFGGAPEDAEVQSEVRAFLAGIWR